VDSVEFEWLGVDILVRGTWHPRDGEDSAWFEPEHVFAGVYQAEISTIIDEVSVMHDGLSPYGQVVHKDGWYDIQGHATEAYKAALV
jgi:hypothetical protein